MTPQGIAYRNEDLFVKKTHLTAVPDTAEQGKTPQNTEMSLAFGKAYIEKFRTNLSTRAVLLRNYPSLENFVSFIQWLLGEKEQHGQSKANSKTAKAQEPEENLWDKMFTEELAEAINDVAVKLGFDKNSTTLEEYLEAIKGARKLSELNRMYELIGDYDPELTTKFQKAVTDFILKYPSEADVVWRRYIKKVPLVGVWINKALKELPN